MRVGQGGGKGGKGGEGVREPFFGEAENTLAFWHSGILCIGQGRKVEA